MSQPALILTMTSAGLTRFTAAQASEDIDLTVASVGLTNTPFAIAPTLTALPGEFRRIATIAGSAVGDNIVHMIVRDDSDSVYAVRGFGLFLADGTLFAVYGQPDPIVGKSAGSSLLLALDVAFPTADIAQLTFGDTNFLNPPATTVTKGIVKLATPAEGLSGTDTLRVPPVAVVAAMIGAIPQSTTQVPGLVELATQAEGLGRTDPHRVPPVAVVAEMVTSALVARVPPGIILLWSGLAAAVPVGWAVCDGRTVDRADGQGQIVTPDLRGRVPVGVSAAHPLGSTFGAETVTSSRVADHAHAAGATVDAAGTGVTVVTTARTVDAGGSASNVLTTATANDPTHAHTASVSVQPDGAHDHQVAVMQPSIALHFIIKV